ncbi:MAG: alanine-tRNA synthetase second additional domain-containing protein [Eubacterium sp.]
MSYSQRMQRNNLYSVYFAPRGKLRMVDLGMQFAQQYLSPFDHIIGFIGDAGSGKSMLIRGMFPGLDLTNDDEGVNIRPLPLLDIHEGGFYTPHTYHVDVRFEAAFTPIHVLADAVLEVAKQEKRVIVEHFELLYDALKRNADLLIGVGEEIIITRPGVLGPDPDNISKIVYKSIQYRKMAHSAEDLCARCLGEGKNKRLVRSDVRHGFVLEFEEKPDVDLEELEAQVKEIIAQDLKISYQGEDHVVLGNAVQWCLGPRMHVSSTGKIKNFSLIKEFVYDSKKDRYLIIGQVGKNHGGRIRQLNEINDI